MNGTARHTGPLQEPAFYEFQDAQRLGAALSQRLAVVLAEDVEREGRAGLVLSGGSTPRPLFARLRDAPLPWSRITVTLADERWVPADAPDSNERLVRAELLKGPAAAARFVGLKTAHTTPEAGAEEAGRRLRTVPRPFSATVLGLGVDGHTASLFPAAEGLADVLDPACPGPVMPVRPPAGAGPATLPRLTMTLPVLTDARLVVFYFTGAEKRAVYERALAGPGNLSMPVRAVLGSARRIEVWWAP